MAGCSERKVLGFFKFYQVDMRYVCVSFIVGNIHEQSV